MALYTGSYRSSELQAVTELDEKSRKATSKDLGKKALERWECILHYVALPSQKSEKGVSSTTKQLFKTAGLTSGGDGNISRLNLSWSKLYGFLKFEWIVGWTVTW